LREVTRLTDLRFTELFADFLRRHAPCRPHVSAIVHHGGNNTFTEALEAGVPALVLPFSSDQFCVAHDAERSGAGVRLDLNALTAAQVGTALRGLLDHGRTARLREPRGDVRAMGPDRGAERLAEVLDRAVGSRAEQSG
jgi:UDP:flavonoid glycosyltransferase YjiC (YdhE family)